MRYISLFEEFDRSLMSRDQKREYYKSLRRTLSPEERTYTIDKMLEFDIPKEIIDNMSS